MSPTKNGDFISFQISMLFRTSFIYLIGKKASLEFMKIELKRQRREYRDCL